ncbi:unnamed protein product [Cuscuta epithymum]|uniref:Uncharacterized protein n=1 Tax=Cuscuta epithymum TaxID=186058 RepID=A0AAV0D4V0_9ASTE|nr:unnamed protein product [Cuscuta epithymum]
MEVAGFAQNQHFGFRGLNRPAYCAFDFILKAIRGCFAYVAEKKDLTKEHQNQMSVMCLLPQYGAAGKLLYNVGYIEFFNSHLSENMNQMELSLFRARMDTKRQLNILLGKIVNHMTGGEFLLNKEGVYYEYYWWILALIEIVNLVGFISYMCYLNKKCNAFEADCLLREESTIRPIDGANGGEVEQSHCEGPPEDL